MLVQIVSTVYRRRYGAWVPSRTPGIRCVNQQQIREFDAICSRLGRPGGIQYYITRPLTLTHL